MLSNKTKASRSIWLMLATKVSATDWRRISITSNWNRKIDSHSACAIQSISSNESHLKYSSQEIHFKLLPESESKRFEFTPPLVEARVWLPRATTLIPILKSSNKTFPNLLIASLHPLAGIELDNMTQVSRFSTADRLSSFPQENRWIVVKKSFLMFECGCRLLFHYY